MSKPNLPKNWVVAESTKFPGCIYYFNVVTNQSTWDYPQVDSTNSNNTCTTNMSKLPSKRKKKELSPSLPEIRPLTPEDNCDKRPKLRAKRRVSSQVPVADDKNQGSKDTPQMRALKEKMMMRQAKGNALKRSKIIKSPEIINSSKCDDTSVNNKIINKKIMTPQMRILNARIQARKSLDASVTKQQSSTTSKSNVQVVSKILTRGRRAKSIGGVSLISESSDQSLSINNLSCTSSECDTSSTQLPQKKSKLITRINEKLESIRTIEAPPGVACKRIIVEKKETPNDIKLNRDTLSLDLALTSSSTSSSSSPGALGETPSKRSRIEQFDNTFKQNSQNIAEISDNTSEQSKSSDELSPNIYKNAAERLRSLRNRLSRESQIIMEKRRMQHVPGPDSTLETFINTSDKFDEDMEWEPIEDERIFNEIKSVRAQLSAENTNGSTTNEISKNALSLDELDGRVINRRVLYIVIDTNVLLTNLEIVEEARDAVFKRYGRPIIVIPWTTIRELDYIKDDKTHTRPESLKCKARRAIRFLNAHFSAKHPRVLGQTLNDVALNNQKFNIDCPDDEILQTCLQVRNSKNTVVLLSYDRNLCNKAMIHDIVTLGRNDNFEKIDLITEFDCKNESSLAVNLKITAENSPEIPSPLSKELAAAEDLYEETKSLLNSFLTIIVAKEMENLFGESWERYTIIKPPWNAITVLKCAMKHWIAAVSDSFIRRGESILKELYETICKLEYNRRLNDVENIIQLCFDLVQCLKTDKNSNILTRFLPAFDELRKKYKETVKELQDYELNDEIGLGMSETEQEAKATIAFRCFKHIYEHARDLCGIAAKSMGMPCSFSYNEDYNQMEIDDIRNRRPEVAANVNRLLLILSTALEDIQQLNVNHRHVTLLYDGLETLYNSLLPDTQNELSDILSPIDIYFCLKRKEKSLKIGVGQFQELSSHFCRMASFKST